ARYMAGATRFLASAAVGSLMVVGLPLAVRAQAERAPASPPVRTGSFASGTLEGLIKDETGNPIAGVVVSALGSTTTVAVTAREGRFEFSRLAPGPYQLRAHLTGFVAPRSRTVQVLPSGRATYALALRRAGTTVAVIAAGVAAAD